MQAAIEWFIIIIIIIIFVIIIINNKHWNGRSFCLMWKNRSWVTEKEKIYSGSRRTIRRSVIRCGPNAVLRIHVTDRVENIARHDLCAVHFGRCSW